MVHIQVMMELLEALLRDCRQQGFLRDFDPVVITLMMFSMLNAAPDQHAWAQVGLDSAELFEAALDMFLNGILLERIDVADTMPHEL